MRTVLVLCFVVAVCALRTDRFALVRAKLDAMANDREVPGGILRVYQRGNSFEHAFGQDTATNRRVAPDTTLKMYSMTKTMTAAAALILLEEAAYWLDEPVSNFIPEFAHITVIRHAPCNASDPQQQNVELLPGRPGGGTTVCYYLDPPVRAMTIRDVLTFTAGYSYSGFNLGLPAEQQIPWSIYQNLFVRGGNQDTADALVNPDQLRFVCMGLLAPRYYDECVAAQMNGTATLNLEEWARRLARVPLIHQPGANYVYGLEADLLGRLVEVWSGKSLGQYFKERILDPLDMKDTMFFVQEADSRLPDLRNRFLHIHDYNGTHLTVDRNSAANRMTFEGPRRLEMGGAGLLSTIPDWTKFAIALNENYNGRAYQGVRLWSPHTLAHAMQTHTRLSAALGWGLGFGTTDGAPTNMFNGLAFGWGGAATTVYRVAPEDDLIVVSGTAVFPSSFGTAGGEYFNQRVFQLALGLTEGSPAGLARDAVVRPTDDNRVSLRAVTGLTLGTAVAGFAAGAVIAAILLKRGGQPGPWGDRRDTPLLGRA